MRIREIRKRAYERDKPQKKLRGMPNAGKNNNRKNHKGER